jgi:hypothetical protein
LGIPRIGKKDEDNSAGGADRQHEGEEDAIERHGHLLAVFVTKRRAVNRDATDRLSLS